MPDLTRPIASVLLALLGALTMWMVGHSVGVRAGRAEVQVKWDAERIENLAENDRVHQTQQEAYRVARIAQDRAADDRRVADAAARSLLQRAQEYAAAATCPAAPGSAPEPAPAVVLADVLGRADQAAGELAAALDRSFVAGRACERTVDAMTAGAGTPTRTTDELTPKGFGRSGVSGAGTPAPD